MAAFQGGAFQVSPAFQTGVPVGPAIPPGGSGYPAPHGLMWRKKTFRQKVDEWIEDDFKELYEELTETTAKKAAAKVVKPFAVKEAKATPKPAQVDWERVRQDKEAIRKLIALYERQIAVYDRIERERLELLEDDEEAIMGVMF